MKRRRARIGAVLLLWTATGCANPDPTPARTQTTPPGKTVAGGDRLTLAFANAVTVPGKSLRISFARVVSESRCPRSVVCVWEGDASILLRVANARDSSEVELHTNPRFATTAEAFGSTIELVDLQPYPEHPSELKPAGYTAHLLVR